MNIPIRIKREREAKGLTVRGLGKLLGVSGSAVSQWEGGGNISVDNRVNLSDVLGIPIIDLMPPGAGVPETRARNPEEILLLERFRIMRQPQREAYLRLLVLQTEPE